MTFIVDGTNGGFFPSWTTATRPASPAVGQMGYNTTIGQFDAYTSGGWVSVATTTSTSNAITSAQMPTGTVLQVVNSSYSTLVTNSTSTFADTGLTATITPKFSTSKILVMISHQSSSKSNGNSLNDLGLNLCRNGSQIVQFTVSSGYTASAAPGYFGINFNYVDSPATTSSTVYKTQFKNSDYNGANVGVQTDSMPSTMILLEIAA